MAAPFEVLQYSRGLVQSLLARHQGAEVAAIQRKQHVKYFDEYFDICRAATVVVESTYVDHDYLEDFAGYYVRCFSGYERFATRLHFFSCPFDAAAFRALIVGETSPIGPEELRRSYLGFVVVKPLPQTVVGRTCLKTYPSDGGRRHFPSTRPYKASLYGLNLEVTSLAFQEQDQVAAACATSALWSVFQGTAVLFHHPVPSPVEITKAAAVHIPHTPNPVGRALPNSGLTPTQMAYGVRHVGLEPHLVGAADVHALQRTAYAYLQGQVPMLLGMELGETPPGKHWESRGLHAVALTGFSLGRASPTPWGSGGVLFRSTRIDKLYVHDDQVGPFARMEIQPSGQLNTQWPGRATPTLEARPTLLLVPLYNKIRISSGQIDDIVVELDALIETIRPKTTIANRFEWDVHLSTINTVKSEWFTGMADPSKRERLLARPMPKHLWRVRAMAGAIAHLDLLFDATDLEQGDLFVDGFDPIGDLSAALAGLIGHVSPVVSRPVRAIIQAASSF